MRKIVLAVALLAMPELAFAYSCDSIAYAVHDAETNLRRTANETDIESAQIYARRAKNALDEASIAANDCGCSEAQNEFDRSARKARWARDADNTKELMDSISQSIRAYSSALEALQRCNSTK